MKIKKFLKSISKFFSKQQPHIVAVDDSYDQELLGVEAKLSIPQEEGAEHV